LETKLNIKTIRELWQQTGEQHWLPVQGTSMLPVLHEGDEVRISHDLSAVHRGDILVYQKSDGLVAHRVVGIYQHPGTSHQYLTKGDNCSYFDPPLRDEALLGRITAIRRNAKERSLTTPAWRFWNGLLAGYHWCLATIFRVLRPTVHAFRKKNS
jgi:signal peptidase I